METTKLSIEQMAQLTAIEYHAGTINKHDGEIYLAHVARVSFNAAQLAPAHGVSSTLAVAAAWLHDVVEETVLTMDAVHNRFVGLYGDDGAQVAQAVRLVSKNCYPSGTSNELYYRAIAEDKLATCVKMADITDNFGRNHLIVDPDKAARMAKKYSLGMSILGRNL